MFLTELCHYGWPFTWILVKHRRMRFFSGKKWGGGRRHPTPRSLTTHLAVTKNRDCKRIRGWI